MRSGLMVGSPVWVWLVVWCLVCVASAGYLWCACWRGCVDGGDLSALSARGVGAGFGRLPLLLGGCSCAWRWRPGSVRSALGGRGWVRVRVLTCTCCGLRGVCGRRVCCCRACGGLCCLVERGWCVLCVDGVGSGRRGWCRCGCLGLGAACGRVVRVVWSAVMVGSPTCAAGGWWVWSVVWCPVRAVRGWSAWAGWWWWLWLNCFLVAA